MDDRWRPRRFIGAAITVEHQRPPELKKKPPPPDAFDWAGQTYRVTEVVSSWTRYERRGRMAANQQPAHLETASRRGSWGVGRFYFRVRTDGGQVFDVYYDRQPDAAGDRAGHWFVWRELEDVTPDG